MDILQTQRTGNPHSKEGNSNRGLTLTAKILAEKKCCHPERSEGPQHYGSAPNVPPPTPNANSTAPPPYARVNPSASHSSAPSGSQTPPAAFQNSDESTASKTATH